MGSTTKKAGKAEAKTYRGPAGVPMTKTEWLSWRGRSENRAERRDRLAEKAKQAA